MNHVNTVPTTVSGQANNDRQGRKMQSNLSVFERLYSQHTVASAGKRVDRIFRASSSSNPNVHAKKSEIQRSTPRKSEDFGRLHQHHTKASFSKRAYAQQSMKIRKILDNRYDKIRQLDRFFGAMGDTTAARIVNVPIDEFGCTALPRAILVSSSLAVVDKLLRIGANVNQQNKFGRTPLSMLVTKHNISKIDHDIFERLVRARADVHLADRNGKTPLHAICSEISRRNTISTTQVELIQNIVNQGTRGFGVNLVDNMGCTALHYICNKYATADQIDKNTEIVQILIHAGSKVLQQARSNQIENGKTPLHNVIDVRIAKLLMWARAGVVNIACDNGDLPLHTCLYGSVSCGWFILYSESDDVFQRRTNMAAYLIRNGADLLRKNYEGARAIDIIVKLLKLQPFHKVTLGESPSSVSARIIRLLQMILPAFKSRNVTVYDDNNSTALHLACQHCNDRSIVDVLLLIDKNDEVSFVNAVDVYGKTALHYAVARDSGGALACALPFLGGIQMSNDKLFRVNINVNLRDSNQQTPLHLLFSNSNSHQQNVVPSSVKNSNDDDSLILTIVQRLLDKDGVDVLSRDVYGMTPLQWAAVRQDNQSKTTPSILFQLVQHPSFLSVVNK